MNWHTCMSLESLWIYMRGQPMLNWQVSCLLKHDKLLLLWFIIGRAFVSNSYNMHAVHVDTYTPMNCTYHPLYGPVIFSAYIGICTASHTKLSSFKVEFTKSYKWWYYAGAYCKESRVSTKLGSLESDFVQRKSQIK